MAQVHTYKLELSLTESDIGSVKKGQAATVTVNAADGEKYAAHVSEVGVLSSSSSSSSSSAVSYPVTLTLDQSGSDLKSGMSATADIVTGQASGLVVPNQALTGSTVTVVKKGKRTTQVVETGLAGDSSTQILTGLNVGDQVVVSSASAQAGAASAGGTSTGGSGQSGFGGLSGRGRGTGGGFGGGLGGGFGGGPPAGGFRGGGAP